MFSPSGWMEREQFLQWLEKVFVPAVQKLDSEHILVIDGHSSHVTLQVIEICKQHGIRLICLPARSSHILQPLDVGIYCHVKKVWRDVIKNYYETTKFKNVDKDNFPRLIKQLYENDHCFTRLHAISGFEHTGLFPLDKSKVDKSKLKIA